jgi:putative ABC transport system permease protein
VLFQIALRSLLQHRRRTLLLGLAIASVTALLVGLLGLSAGTRETIVKSATTLMTGHVNVGGFYKVTSGQAAPVVTDFAKVRALIQEQVPEVTEVVFRGRGWAKLVSETGSLQVGMSGLSIFEEPRFREVIQVLSGSLDELAKPNTLLLFKNQAEKLGVQVGDALTISAPTPRGVNNTIDVRVAAIAQEMGLLSSFNTYVEEGTLRRLYQLTDTTTGALHLYLRDRGRAKHVQAELRELLAQSGYRIMEDDPRAFWMKFESVSREAWTGQKLDVTTWEDEISFMKWTVSALDVLSYILVFVLLVIISVGIMNTWWIAIRERTREIGTLRAIGMQRRTALAMFVIEGFCLGLAGTLLGAVGGLAVSAGINALQLPVPLAVQLVLMSDKLRLAPEAGAVLGSIVLITACTTLVSLFPSFIAARMKPVTAMHHLG